MEAAIDILQRSRRRGGPTGFVATLKARRETIVAACAWSILLVLLLVGGRLHEPWFDEAQAWLVAQDSDPLQILTQVVRYEGTPALWHLLLWGVQRLGLGYGGFYLVSAALALVGAWLVLFKSPFPLWMRIGVVFSYFFAYQYAVVARSYALDLALAPLLACLFERRAERPLAYGVALGLLANTNAHSFILAIPLGLDFTWTCARRPAGARGLAAVLICAALGVAAILQAWPPHDPQFKSAGGVQLMVARPLVLFVEGLIERADPFLPWDAGVRLFWSGVAMSLLVVIPTAMLVAKAGRLPLATMMTGALAIFYLLVYSNYWHSGIVFLMLLLILWISWRGFPRMRRDHRIWLLCACATLLAYQDVDAGAAWLRDLRAPYSASRDAAQEIAEIGRIHPGERIGAAGFKTFSVEPFLATQPFANADPGPRRFYSWRKDAGVPLYASPARWAALTRSRDYRWLLLSPDNARHDFHVATYVAAAAKAGYCVVHTSPGAMVWKTRLAEPDSLILFGRCKRPGQA